MQYVPNAQMPTRQLFIGSIKLNAGFNKLSASDITKLKSHPSYSTYVDAGLLVPNVEEKKPNGKERAVAKRKVKSKVKVKKVEAKVEEIKVEEIKVEPIVVEPSIEEANGGV